MQCIKHKNKIRQSTDATRLSVETSGKRLERNNVNSVIHTHKFCRRTRTCGRGSDENGSDST